MRSFNQSLHHGGLMNSPTHTNPSSDSSSKAAERYRNFRVQTEILRCLSTHRNWLSARDIARYLGDAGLKPYSTRNLQNVLSNLVEGDANIERVLEGRTYRYRWVGERPNWLYGLSVRFRRVLAVGDIGLDLPDGFLLEVPRCTRLCS